jgi:D-psicose/D-tagatose/L-ribulose 3-epimerase
MRSPDPFIRKFAVEHLKRAIEAAYYLGGTEVGGVLYSNWPRTIRTI